MVKRSITLSLFAFIVLACSMTASAQIGISVSFSPPALPVYEQPICPQDGYLWTPGYWAYEGDDYFWVPGTWVLPPQPGLFWTPGYWAWAGEGFTFYDGYWGPEVGFYGGINYGFGYFGEGYEGGRWDHDRFFYNRSVNNVNQTVVRNVYNTTIVNNTTNVTRVSYNGGNGGTSARSNAAQEAVARGRHIPPVAAQTEHLQAARSNPEQRASANRGKPPVAATEKPGAFRDRGVIAAREAGAPYNPDRNRRANQPQRTNEPPRAENGNQQANNPNQQANRVVHPNDIPRREATPPVNSGNEKADRKYQQQAEKMQAKQDQERQKLQQKQEQDHQKMAKQNADDARKQQTEQRHQQQTQQLQQRQEMQQQRIQQRVQHAPERPNSREQRGN